MIDLGWMQLLVGGGGLLITLITFWMTISSRLATAEGLAKNAESRAVGAEAVAANAILKCEMLASNVNRDRVEMASEISALKAISEQTTRSLTSAEMRLAKSIEDIGDKIDKVSDTIIKTLGQLIDRK